MYILKDDNQLLVLTHLSQLLDLVSGFGGTVVPIIIWAIKKDEIYQMNEQGKAIINFRISMIIYAIACIPLILLLGLGIIGLVAVGILTLIFPIINAVRVSNRQAPNYPLSIQFLK